MRDIELYKAILGLTPPWTVVDVELDVKGQDVTVRVQAGDGPFPCPECQVAVPGYDRKLRRWRHLDTCQFTTWIEADVPRVECPIHGVKQLPVPWAEPGSQFTALFERFAIDLLRECAVQGGADLLRITWDEAWGIKARAVARGLARRGREVVARLGVDEKAIAKRHRYLTVVADLDRSRVLYLAGTASRRASTASGAPSRPPSARGSRPWRWTCGSPTSSRPASISTRRQTRSCSISSTLLTTSMTRWTGCGRPNTGR